MESALERDTMLTTHDNVFNPFTQWDEWYQFDEGQGHCTCGLIARIARTSPKVSDEENNRAIDEAMNWILDHDYLGEYELVTNPDKITNEKDDKK